MAETVHHLSRRDARRIAVRAQLLTAPRPSDLLEAITQLGVVQVDVTTHVAPSAELVCWSRLGSSYDADALTDLLDERRLIELEGLVRPAEDIALFTAEMAVWPGREPLKPWQIEIDAWVEANALCRSEILDRLSEEAPLPARAFDDTCEVPWRSTGWSNSRNVLRLLGFMEGRGEVAVAARHDRERQWDLASRVYPDVDPVPYDEAQRLRSERRLAALGIARARRPVAPGEPMGVGDVGERATVDGVAGEWRVDPRQLGLPFRGRTALLSPLDRLVMDRVRLEEIFEYEYLLEMYKPAAKRRWGYYALPVLHGDRLVGKLDATANRRTGVLQVNAMHWDVEPTSAMTAAVDREIASLAGLLALEVTRP